MPVKIRLARRGRKKNPYYHVVVADARAPRDGKYIENLGSYNPMTVPATIELDRDKALEWLQKGAQPTETARAILKLKGVYYKKHLLRGVAKGALTEEKAAEMYQAWIDEKDSKIESKVAEVQKKKEDFWKMVSGEIKPVVKAADKSAGEAFRKTAEKTSEEAPAAEVEVDKASKTEAPVEEVSKEEEAVVEEAPKVEAPVEATPKAAAEETPAAVEKTPEVEEENKDKAEDDSSKE